MTIYRIGEVDFDPDATEICVRGQLTHLQPQVSNVLDCLIRHTGEVVSKDLLVAEAWKGRRTSDESVTRCISLLRAHFADQDQRHLIETIPKKGYRFTGHVEKVEPQSCSSHSQLADNGTVNVDLGDHAKTAVNIVLTGAVIFMLLSALIVAADFFTLR